jgi:hypothetical protein
MGDEHGIRMWRRFLLEQLQLEVEQDMKRITGFITIMSVFAFHPFCFADAPRQIAGFALGANVSQYANSLRMEKSLPLRHMEYLSEAEIIPPDGFKSGYVFFGNCREPGRIVRIKLKYEREDKEFFEELLEHFGKKFGKPDEYKGDAFRVFIAWKWSFKDKSGNKTNLILQHNSEDDEDYTSGNSMKMSQMTLIEQERQCYDKKHPESKEGAEGTRKESSRKKPDFKLLVPE